jgi:hypothetical protein
VSDTAFDQFVTADEPFGVADKEQQRIKAFGRLSSHRWRRWAMFQGKDRTRRNDKR